MSKLRICGLTVLIAMLAATGCTGAPTEPNPEIPNGARSLDMTIDAALDRASDDARTSPEQIAALEALYGLDSIEFDVLRQAALNMIDCLEKAGLTDAYIEVQVMSGLDYPVVQGVQAPSTMEESAVEALIGNCEAAHQSYVSYAYAQQPAAQDFYWSEFAKHSDEVRECLKAVGLSDTDIGETDPEMVDTAMALFLSLDPALAGYEPTFCLGDLDPPLW